MKPVVLSDVLAVGEFPTPDQIAILAKAGFKSLLNNQPDGEVARFLSDADVAAEASHHGLAHAYAPLSSRTPPPDEMERYAVAIAALPAPIYAFCYSGARAAAACALSLTAASDVDSIVSSFTEAGFDLSALKPWLEEERGRHAGGDAGRPAATTASAGNTPSVIAELPPSPQIQKGPERASGLPNMIVLQPRAYGYGGYAV